MNVAEGEDAPLCLAPKVLSRLPGTPLPDDACDSHFHVFRSGAPLAEPRSYTPQMQTFADWQAYAKAVNITRGVLVQPSVYGFDNRVLLEALEIDPVNLRAVVVVPADPPQMELKELDRKGVRGIRVNTRNKGGLPLAATQKLAARAADLGWLLQFQVHPEQLADLARLAGALACPILLDHVGFISMGTGNAEQQHAALRRLLDTGRCYVKLTAPYRLDTGPNYPLFGTLASSLARAHPDRLLWGSDWPHTELWRDMPDDAELIELAQGWLPDAAARRRIFAGNAGQLFFSR
jgi:predicted TIM-barrel fold metal-dependent hydrolase